MYHPVRRKCYWQCIVVAFIVTICVKYSFSDKINSEDQDEDLDNNIIDFDSKYDTKYNNRDTEQWRVDNFKKDAYRYSVQEDSTKIYNEDNIETSTNDYLNVVPLELVTVTEESTNIIQTTTDIDLTVIPLSTTHRVYTTPSIITTDLDTVINYTTTDKSINNEDITTTESEQNETTTTTTTTNHSEHETTTKENDLTTTVTDTTTDVTSTTQKIQANSDRKFNDSRVLWDLTKVKENRTRIPKRLILGDQSNVTSTEEMKIVTENSTSTTESVTTTIQNTTKATINKQLNSTNSDIIIVSDEPNSNRTNKSDITDGKEDDVPIFTELDLEDEKEVPEDYYDSKDVVPTKAPNTDALSVIFGLAGSVVESVAERVVPKGIFDLFKRMQRQNEALEAERLRSREENGGIGQFGRGILKSISSGISRPFTQLMSARDIGSLDNDRGFVASVANGVSNVANVATSLGDAFKNRVQAIYPGTVWCGDGHSAQARSSDLGLFFFTDTCCRQHDACKIYIRAGDTKYGLTNTGVFTRSHCSCDARFRECLRKTNSLVSSQIGLTYFNVLGPQCFRKAHPIVRCVRKTRLTGQKCEEYELDYTKPKMWQWFDNETF